MQSCVLPPIVWACLHKDTYLRKDTGRWCCAQLHHRTYTLRTIPYASAGGLHIAHSPLYSSFVFKYTAKFSLSIVHELPQDLSTVSLKVFSKFPTAKKKAKSQSYATWEVAHAQGTQGLQYKPRT